jgi:hypothetical protein
VTRVRREDLTVALDREEVDVPSGGKLWLYVQHLQPTLACTFVWRR